MTGGTWATPGPPPELRGTTVLFVCTGNVCRSPAAELLLASRLPDAGLTVASAGTRALVGEPVDGPIAGLLRAASVLPKPFAARALTSALLRSADLVLVMERAHRAAAVTLVPAAVRRVLRLREAAQIAAATAEEGWPDDVAAHPAARLAALPALAARYRGLAGGADVDVPDPYRRSAATYRESFRLIKSAVDQLAEAVVTDDGARRATVGAPPVSWQRGLPSGEHPQAGDDAGSSWLVNSILPRTCGRVTGEDA